MSRKTEEGGYGSAENDGWPNGTPQGEGTAVTETTDQAAVPPNFLAIEEHAKAQRISAPVFAAVRQMQGWSEGKKITDAEFSEAVYAFLGAPIGGKK